MDLGNNIITAALTISGGVFIYVAGKVIERAFIEPVNAQADAITDLLKTLEFYRDIYVNPERWLTGEYEVDVREMVQEFRRVAATLAARNRTIPWHGLLRAIGLVPRRANVFMATTGIYIMIRIVAIRPGAGVEVTEDTKKALSDGILFLADTVKDQLNVGERPVKADVSKMLLAKLEGQYEEVMKTLERAR